MDSKLSCETQLAKFTSDILKTTQDRKQWNAIITDFPKAFKKVSHTSIHLIYKLQRVGIDNQMVVWIESPLTARMKCVVVDGETSESLYFSGTFCIGLSILFTYIPNF